MNKPNPDITRLNPSTTWSDATIYNGTGYFVEVANELDTAKGDFAAQTQQVLEQAKNTLASINSDHSRLLSATIYITDFANLPLFNQLWQAWLPEQCAPSRACIKAELANKEYLLEIAFVAAIKP